MIPDIATRGCSRREGWRGVYASTAIGVNAAKGAHSGPSRLLRRSAAKILPGAAKMAN